jgi:hypothetical protein
VSRELLDYKMARDPQSIPGFLEFIQERLDEGRLHAQLLESLQSLQEFVKNNQKDPNSKGGRAQHDGPGIRPRPPQWVVPQFARGVTQGVTVAGA